MNLKFLGVTFFVLMTSACAQVKHQKTEILVLPDQGPVVLEYKQPNGYTDVTDYKSQSITKTYDKGEIVNRTTENLDFTVESKVTEVNPKRKTRTFVLTTLEKDGKQSLSDFAMPEMGESLDYVLAANGQVLRVGDISPGTIYYIPPVSLPKNAVRVGDSWPLTAEWISAKSGVPLRLEVASILRSIRDCGAAGKCAELEVSGDVSLLNSKHSNISSVPVDGQNLKLRFRSEIKGRILLAIDTGTVLFSKVRSVEYLGGEKDTVEIASCMLSVVREPKNLTVPISQPSNMRFSEVCDENLSLE